MWREYFGFSKDPYDTHPIKGDEDGEKLLVGRKGDLRKTKNRIKSTNTVVTIEGPNGVGKTSLVLVAAFQLENETRECGKSSIIFLREPFQLTTEDSALAFKRKVYAGIASHFIKHESTLKTRLDLQFGLKPLEKWLESPLSFSGSVSIAGIGGGGGQSPNQTSGFDLHGFFNIVDKLLEQAFSENGGVLCVLDNLEILNTSQIARQKLEELRDDLFSKHGIKWVVCGAKGIVKSVATSPRLQGRLREPLEIVPLDAPAIGELISTRTDLFRERTDAIPPVGVGSFSHVFDVLNSNLRDALKFSADFSLWIYENSYPKNDEENLGQLFDVWLAEMSESYFKAISVPPRAWTLFDEICDYGGSISPSDFGDFNFNSPQNMRGQVLKLENADLVSTEFAESDHRRKTITVTAKGWLLRHYRTGFT